MNYFKDIGLTYYKKGKKKLRKIFSTGYENLTTLIFYHDTSHKYILVVAKEDDPPLVLEKYISRAEAFRLMNTRVC